MTVIRWNPLRDIDDLFARAGQYPAGGQSQAHQSASFTPLAEVSETPSNYFVELELPGVAADMVDVSVHEGVLTIAGERKAPKQRSEEPTYADESAEQARQVHRSERRYGTFERRFRLPKDAQVDAITASAREGVLSVSIGRREEAARRAIEVRVA